MSFLGDIADAIGIGTTGVPWGTVVSAGSALLGFEGQQSTNQANLGIAQQQTAASAQMAQDQMAFQERMSGTSYQRAVQDMEKAGLNPMLAYSQGGASTPSGAMGNAPMPAPMQNPYAAGMASAQQATEVQRTAAQTDLTKAQEEEAKARATRELASAGQLDAQRKMVERQLYEAIDTYTAADNNPLLGRRAGIMAKGATDVFQSETADAEARSARAYYIQRARELQNKAELLGLDIPEALANSRLWQSANSDNMKALEWSTGMASKFFSGAASARRSLKAY